MPASASASIRTRVPSPEGSSRWRIVTSTGPETVRTVYVYEGSVTIGEQEITAPTGAVLRPEVAVTMRAGDAGAEVLMLQGVPIGEPVAQHGPFVMNDQAGIIQAFEDYQRTGFGGWPFDRDDPVHSAEQGRFARHADGQVETVTKP